VPIPLALTPTSGSWLNPVERWFALITQRMIRRGTFRNVAELESAIISAWVMGTSNLDRSSAKAPPR
jgi:hypothetical protein